jgi:hypothetical protein
VWALSNRTSFGAGRNWTRDKDGIHWWLVAVRATYTIAPDGRLTLADEQTPPLLAPEYHGEPGTSSLRSDSDLLDLKASTDVLLIGSAHAPRERPAATVPVTLRAGAIEKTLVVHGERIYRDGLAPTAPQRFLRLPLTYELAFGGSDLSATNPSEHRIDERNPVGRGFARRRSSQVNRPAHAIEYPSGDPSTRGPAGFGPVDRGWLPRRSLAGTYDARWAESKRPLLPDDYDPAFALASPIDQRPARPFRGGERVELINLTPEGRLAFELPRVELHFSTRFGRHGREHAATLVTILIEPDAWRLSMVWQTSLRVPAREADYLDVTAIVERRVT